MTEQLELHPSGLSRSQFARLEEYMRAADSLALDELLNLTEGHLERASRIYQANRLNNVRLAAAIRDSIIAAASEWENLSMVARHWLAAAILYFAQADDQEPDFSSPIGFEDDAEVLNSCLRFAQLDELCLNPEDYDDV
ncbi:MAG: hypothetical protein DMF61_24865 [Blastocatellia bacterium AA13]|nr:MAG: hypothetical protein DMF61_24865 [Blastocatellia bacterium AA13]